ncbi:RNA exonuclease 1 homolog isoform X3 [Antennarius striatus]|uniref:RNA exonuclease 1 homolog isoform X3 n=1 Tax=Antennarius striatus TaxID=241820 RepID=UPI0035AD7EBB
MFPSSGLFADINCPVSQRGICERPHCLYKHVKELRDVVDASNHSSIIEFAGSQNDRLYAATRAPVNEKMKDECLQELERINKEIESVKHEVEQEQRRLSHYQTVQADDRNPACNLSVSKLETASKCLRSSYGFSPCTNDDQTDYRASKYVVDNSKPRTDLEYDPLSNYSADLRSYSSSGKDHRVKKGRSLKMERKAIPCNQKKAVTDQTQLSQSPLDDSNGDDVLIIDIPPSPAKKVMRVQKPGDALKNEEDLKGVKTRPSLLNSPPPYPASDTANGKVADFLECSKALQRDSQSKTHLQSAEKGVEKGLEPASPPDITHEHDQNQSNLVEERKGSGFLAEISPHDVIHGDGKNNPLQTSNNSRFSTAAAAYFETQCRQRTKQAETSVQNLSSNQRPSANVNANISIHKISRKIPEKMLSKAVIDHVPTESGLKLVELLSTSNQSGQQISSASSLMRRVESSPPSNEQHLKKVNDKVVLIDSDSDELNYSEMELSDTDPMEECFRIFMEENDNSSKQPDVSAGIVEVEKPELVKSQELSGKKRVAHEAKHSEPLARSRPQPQVLVPLCVPAVSRFSSQPSITSKIQQVHQKASMLPASVKGGQALVSSTCQRTSDADKLPSPTAQLSELLMATPSQNAYMNCIPVGTAVIEVGSNLHLILPGGAFPLPMTSSSVPATSLLTPIRPTQTSAVIVKQTSHPSAVTSVQRYRTSAPVIIPAPAQKPTLTSSSAHLTPATSSGVSTTVKQVATKRKSKQQFEAIKEKVPHDIRQRYVNMFTEEFFKTTASVNDAFEKALVEEKTVYNRSVNKLKYLSIAVNALKRLKNQSAVTAKDQNEVNSQRLKGNIPFNLKKFKRNDDVVFYESLRDYILTEDRLIESNYPVQHPEKPGGAVLFADNKKCNTDPLKRICCRCGATYSVSQTGKHIRKEECNYHYGKGVKHRVPGGVETRYSCCEGVMGAPGCQVFMLHVHNSLSLDGFVSTVPREASDTHCPGVYSVNCEMCFTIHGLELSRVTLVNSSLQIIYDTFVMPDNEIIDYNTRFSGICEEDVKDNRTSLREVQQILLSFISSDTILIGHGLETDLCALKLIHGKVVDTSVVFPHHLGSPHKLTLNSLTAEYLRRIIQESVCGHDTAEDATACMELMLWKVKEDGKLKK